MDLTTLQISELMKLGSKNTEQCRMKMGIGRDGAAIDSYTMGIHPLELITHTCALGAVMYAVRESGGNPWKTVGDIPTHIKEVIIRMNDSQEMTREQIAEAIKQY